MTINNTTESIEIVLGANVTSQQLSFLSSFNEISTTGMTPYDINGLSNNTTAVSVMTSPSSGNQRQLRELSIFNNDTATANVTVRFNNSSSTRTLHRSTLLTGESLIYEIENGWTCYDTYGQKKYEPTHIVLDGNIKFPEQSLLQANNTGTNQITTNLFGISLGKADKAYSSITMTYRIVSQAVSITWAEMAIYRVAQPMGIGTQQITERLGFTDVSGVWNTTGIKLTTVNTPTLRKGDDLYVVAGNIATTSATFRTYALADDLSSILRTINNAAASWRPSTTGSYVATAFSNANASIILSWQGNGG